MSAPENGNSVRAPGRNVPGMTAESTPPPKSVSPAKRIPLRADQEAAHQAGEQECVGLPAQPLVDLRNLVQRHQGEDQGQADQQPGPEVLPPDVMLREEPDQDRDGKPLHGGKPGG